MLFIVLLGLASFTYQMICCMFCKTISSLNYYVTNDKNTVPLDMFVYKLINTNPSNHHHHLFSIQYYS